VNGPAVPLERVVELTQLLYLEAELLDTGRYEEWLSLLAPDVLYTAPVPCDVALEAAPGSAATALWPDDDDDDALRLRLFHDDRRLLELRVRKIRTGLLQAENPPSRTVRLIGNVQVLAEVAPGEHPVHSAFVLHRQRRQRQSETLAGHRLDRWRRAPDGWQLVRREIRFAANVLPTKSLSVLF